MAGKATDRRQREHQEKRHQILAAARQIALEEGWRNVTLRKIAERIEYTHPALYSFFKDKDDLLLALLQEGFKQLEAEMSAALDRATGPVDGLQKISAAYLGFAAGNAELYQVMYGLDGAPFGAARTVTEGLTIGAVTARAIRAFDPQRTLDDATVQKRVYLLWAATHGNVSLVMAGRIEPEYARTLQQQTLADTVALVEADLQKAN
jgi:AcrR family transcriptional regulator